MSELERDESRETVARPTDTGLVVFSDDWGRHPSSCQHLIRRLLDRYRVYWVNTIGTRPPRLDLLTVQRGLGKMRSWLRATGGSPTPVGENPRVLEPIMWPSYRSALGRGLNRIQLTRAVGGALAASGVRRRVAVTTIPLVADLTIFW